jgi:hypothetical protein
MLRRARFDAPRFPNNAPKETRHGVLIERSRIGLARAPHNLALARTVAEREAGGPLRFPYLDGEPRAFVEEAKQLRVNRVYFNPLVFNAHLTRFLLISDDVF